MRQLLILILCVMGWAGSATAQQGDGVFRDYDSYSAFVDDSMMQREFSALIVGLGGNDEFSAEQLDAARLNMEKGWPTNFEDAAVFREEDLGGGLRQEGRIFWNGTYYAYYYALLHQRADDLQVLSFLINSSIKPIMERF